MDSVSLKVSKRTDQDRAKRLLKAGEIPAVVYGNKVKSTNIKCKLKEFHAVYLKAGESTLVELDIEGQKVSSLIHALSFEPVTGSYEHIDFYAVDMTKKVTTKVPLAFEGESPAVKNLGAVLVTVHDHVTVTCLPKDLPHNFMVKLAGLSEFHDSVLVSALTVPPGVTIAEAPTTVLVTVQEPRKEEEIAPPAAAVPAEGEPPAAAPGEAAAPGAPAAAGAAIPAPEKAPAKAPPTAEKGKKKEKK